MSTPPDLAAPVNQNMDQRHMHAPNGPPWAYPVIGGGDTRGDGRNEPRARDPLSPMRRALPAAGVVGIVAILVLSLVPGDLRPRVVANDHLEHVLAYFLVMSAFGLLAGSIRRPLAAAVLLALVAGLTEALQRYVPGRHADLADTLAGGLGILLGLLLSAAVMAMLRR